MNAPRLHLSGQNGNVLFGAAQIEAVRLVDPLAELVLPPHELRAHLIEGQIRPGLHRSSAP